MSTCKMYSKAEWDKCHNKFVNEVWELRGKSSSEGRISNILQKI